MEKATSILTTTASKQPKDWKYIDRNVIVDNLFFSADKPNLHHIFPTNYVSKHPGSNELNNNSLMNIAYLTQITNLEISDKNPLKYIQEYNLNPEFETLINNHFLPSELLEWSRRESMPPDALDQFIEKRVDSILEELKRLLAGVNVQTIDTKQKS